MKALARPVRPELPFDQVGGDRTPGTRIVVRPFLTFTSPEIRAWRMSLRIRLRETRQRLYPVAC